MREIWSLGLTPGLERSPGEGNNYPLQYSGLENSMSYIDHGVSKSWTWLSDSHFIYIKLYSKTLLPVACSISIFLKLEIQHSIHTKLNKWSQIVINFLIKQKSYIFIKYIIHIINMHVCKIVYTMLDKVLRKNIKKSAYKEVIIMTDHRNWVKKGSRTSKGSEQWKEVRSMHWRSLWNWRNVESR